MTDGISFKEAMQRYPTGVVVATTTSADGEPRGLTASSFTSISLAPPLILLCIARTATCYLDFERAPAFALNMLRPEQEALAMRFATRGADKFSAGEFELGAQGLPLLQNALAHLVCEKTAWHQHGDHAILVGQVISVGLGDEGAALARCRQRFSAIGQEALHAA
jgi:flavin reductase ActVB